MKLLDYKLGWEQKYQANHKCTCTELHASYVVTVYMPIHMLDKLDLKCEREEATGFKISTTNIISFQKNVFGKGY